MFDKLKLSVKLRVQESANQLAANTSISRQIWVHTVDAFIDEYIYIYMVDSWMHSIVCGFCHSSSHSMAMATVLQYVCSATGVSEPKLKTRRSGQSAHAPV